MGQDTQDLIGNRVVNAAIQLIIEQGTTGVTTQAVATQAQTSKRAIYERFPDKAALLSGVVAALCANSGDAPAAVPREDTANFLLVYGEAVAVRFADTQTARVFDAILSARAEVPEAMAIFWREGPGQAAQAIAERLTEAPWKLARARARQLADTYILDCAGPIIVSNMVAAKSNHSKQRIRERVRRLVTDLMEQLNASIKT